MQILRHIAIRSLLFVALFAALALPPEVVATTSSETPNSPVAHKTSTTKKGVKKSSKKTTKKASKKRPKTAATKTTRQINQKIDQKIAKPVASSGEYVIAAKDGVNVLANPATDAEVRWEIFNRFPLMVKKRQGQWLQVGDFEGDTGWIHQSQVSGEKSVIVCKKRINLRQEPNNEPGNPIIAVVRYGVVFTPIEKKGDWLKVRYDDNTEGWLTKDLVWPANPLD